jgi:hypothetical protein
VPEDPKTGVWRVANVSCKMCGMKYGYALIVWKLDDLKHRGVKFRSLAEAIDPEMLSR